MSQDEVDWRVASGRWHRLYDGTFAVGHAALSLKGRLIAAVLACGPDAVLSHRSAAALWGIRADSRSRIDVTAPGRRGRAPTGIDAHRHGSLRPQDRTVVDGIPCTTVARTMLDLAGVVSFRSLRNALTQAEVARLFDLVAVEEVISRSRGRRGVARLRLAIADHDPADEDARRELERRFLALCRRSGLPRPEVNGHLVLDGISIMPDFLWRDQRLIVETDSRRVHGTTAAFESDRLRDQRLLAAGWRVLRCTWRQLHTEPTRLITTLRTLLQPNPSRRA